MGATLFIFTINGKENTNMMEKEEYEIRIEEFKKDFEKLERNRQMLCTPEGALKKEHIRYKNAYQSLVNKICGGCLEISKDSVSIFQIPDTEEGKKCGKEINGLFNNLILNRLRDIINKGTYDDMFSAMEDFRMSALDVYWDYVKNGMNSFLLKGGQ